MNNDETKEINAEELQRAIQLLSGANPEDRPKCRMTGREEYYSCSSCNGYGHYVNENQSADYCIFFTEVRR